MAEIFLAKLVGEAGFEKKVVIKKILPQWASDADFIAMLVDEAKIAVQLNHPNIVAVHELAREDDQYYIAMEYVNGVDLRRLMQKTHASKERVPVEVALFIATEVLEGLSYAHAKKDPQGRPMEIIHRDISPQNILVSFDGAVKITDFGIARATSRTQETATGVLKGKFAYMSPEQANQGDLDSRSDLFSTAIVLYELVTGERLFHRSSDLETLERVRRGEPDMSPEALKKIPERLKEVLFKALMKSREERFANAAEFRETLLAFARRSKKKLRRERVAEYMGSLFKEEIQSLDREKTQETRVLAEEKAVFLDPTKTVRPVVLARAPDPKIPTIPRLAYIAAAAVVLSVLAFALHPFREEKSNQPHNYNRISESSKVTLEQARRVQERPVPPEIPPPIRADQVLVVAETRPLVETAPYEPPAVVSAKALEGGYLSVQATPWGTVMVDGRSRGETPVRKIPLKPGPHTVSVTHPPTAATATTKLQIAGGREIVCMASFSGGKKIRCE